MSDSLTSAELLANAEQFSPYWPDFIPRQGQQQMAQWIEEAIAQRQSLVVEAPSGAGKTLAYLIPILRQGQRAIISTASRYLQQQLYRHDIPVLQKVLATDQSVALLQGRSHYLCPYYLDKNLHAGDIKDTEQIAQLTQLSNRFRQTGQGEWDKLLPNASSRTRALASSGSDDCLGQQCPQYTNCPLMKARLRAQKADVVVVNHSLLFSDRSLRRDQWADRLPATDVIIIDEAHRLTDFAQTIVGQRVSSYKLRGLITDTEQAIGRYASEQRGLLRYIKQVGTVLLKLPQRLPSSVYYQRPQHLAVVEQCLQMLRTLNRALQKLEQREYSLVELVLRYQRMIECLQQIRAATGLCWVRAYQNGFVIHNIPVSLAALMQELMSEVKGSWIMTSA
ncbi:MAG: ATP-dependent DNA helicase DinG, partial [Oceanicoccus sp.]